MRSAHGCRCAPGHICSPNQQIAASKDLALWESVLKSMIAFAWSTRVLLLTKFAEENARGWRVHPIRIQTLKHLEDYRSHPCVRVSSTLAEGEWMSTFYSFAVRLHEDEGCLELPADVTANLPPSVDDREYLDLLNDFLEETRLRDLWDRTGGLWETVREECDKVVRDWKLADFLHLLFGDQNWKLSLIPNPADPPSFGFGPSAEGTSYAIVGPPCIRKWRGRVSYGKRPAYVAQMAFHEFSHAVWGGIRSKEPWIVEELAPGLWADGSQRLVSRDVPWPGPPAR